MFNTTIQSIHQKLTSREVEVLWKNLKVSPETMIFYLRNPDFQDHPLTHTFLIELVKEKRKLNACSYLTKEQLAQSEVIQWFIQQLCTLSVTDIEKSFMYLLRNDQSYHVMGYVLRQLKVHLAKEDVDVLLQNGDIAHIIRG